MLVLYLFLARSRLSARSEGFAPATDGHAPATGEALYASSKQEQMTKGFSSVEKMFLFIEKMFFCNAGRTFVAEFWRVSGDVRKDVTHANRIEKVKGNASVGK
jgi:hypothetical protein